MTEQLADDAGRLPRTTGSTSATSPPTWHEQLARVAGRGRSRPGVAEPNAMVLATAGEDGRPSSRTVLCKGLDARGVVFYTNYTSAKSHDLRATRVRLGDLPLVRRCTGRCTCAGTVELVAAGGDAGLLGDPAARLAARRVGVGAVGGRCATAGCSTTRWRPSTQPVRRRRGRCRCRRTGAAGGSCPEQVEFWQGRSDRMHDRLRFELDARRPHVAGAPPRALTALASRAGSRGRRLRLGAGGQSCVRPRRDPTPGRYSGTATDPARRSRRARPRPGRRATRRLARPCCAARSPTPARCAPRPTAGCGSPGSSR